MNSQLPHIIPCAGPQRQRRLAGFTLIERVRDFRFSIPDFRTIQASVSATQWRGSAQSKIENPESKISRASRGFTLIELLTVIVIIGILAAILIPTVAKVRETAAKATCASNLRQIALATVAHAHDNKGTIPLRPRGTVSHKAPHAFVTADWNEEFRPWLGGTATKYPIMYCPGPLKTWRNHESSNYTSVIGNYTTYAYWANLPLKSAVVTGYNLDSATLREIGRVPARFPLWTCVTTLSGGRFHGHSDPDTGASAVQGQNAARADGSVRWVKGENLISFYSYNNNDYHAPGP